MFARLHRGSTLLLAGTLLAALGTIPSAGASTAPAPSVPAQSEVAQAPFELVDPSTTAGWAYGIVSVQFDDGTKGHFRNAKPTLDALGIPATFNIISRNIDAPGYMTALQLRKLARAGNELGNHTASHTNLTTLTRTQIDAEFSEAQTVIKEKTGVTPTTCAYPYGALNSQVRASARTFFHGCRSTVGGLVTPENFDAYKLTTFNVSSTTPVADIEAAIDNAAAAKSWLNLVYHAVAPNPQANPETTTPDQFNDAMDYLAASGIATLTVEDALTAIGH